MWVCRYVKDNYTVDRNVTIKSAANISYSKYAPGPGRVWLWEDMVSLGAAGGWQPPVAWGEKGGELGVARAQGVGVQGGLLFGGYFLGLVQSHVLSHIQGFE